MVFKTRPKSEPCHTHLAVYICPSLPATRTSLLGKCTNRATTEDVIVNIYNAFGPRKNNVSDAKWV